MNQRNELRTQAVAEQLLIFTSNDATPTTDFGIVPQYTLIAHLPEAVNAAIFRIASQLKNHFPDQYYYAPSQYHLTVVPIPSHIQPARAIELIAPIVRGWRLPIRARGVAANRLQASVVLYPEEETLLAHRTKLRTALGIPEQAFTIHRPVWDELLWTNFMRFTTRPSEELLALLRTHANDELGSFMLSRYELYAVATKTLDPTSSELLHTFEA